MCYNEITGLKSKRLKTGVELKYGGICKWKLENKYYGEIFLMNLLQK